MKITNLVTINLTYSPNTFLGLFYLQICAAVKAFLVAISIIVVKNIIFTFQKQSSQNQQQKIKIPSS